MRFSKFLAAASLGIAALALGGCATGLNTKVSRYSAAQIPLGQSFYVVPRQGAPSNEFYRYAAMVSQQLAAKGYRPAGAPGAADMLVRVDYGVDQGRTERVQEPYYAGPGYGPYGYGGRFGRWRDPFYDPFWGVYYGRPYYSSWGRLPYYYGWDDPFWYDSGYYGGGYGRGLVREYTVYKSYLDMDIVQRATNAPLFEGHARARSQDDELDKLVPPLITAMFTGFPGKNGETVRITVPTAAKRAGN
jgi:hypothetical protein